MKAKARMNAMYVVTAVAALAGSMVFLIQAALDIDGSWAVDTLFAAALLYASASFWCRRYDHF
jgi:low affinity Fe/Cu permease